MNASDYPPGGPLKVNRRRYHPKELCDLASMADERLSTDVLGSYTGMARNGEDPVQDADDL